MLGSWRIEFVRRSNQDRPKGPRRRHQSVDSVHSQLRRGAVSFFVSGTSPAVLLTGSRRLFYVFINMTAASVNIVKVLEAVMVAITLVSMNLFNLQVLSHMIRAWDTS
jgi:hypothetical protein